MAQVFLSAVGVARLATSRNRQGVQRLLNIAADECRHEYPRKFQRGATGQFSLGPAQLEYRIIGVREISVESTSVPEELRGKGVASALAQAAFDHARCSGLRLLPRCEYVSDHFVPRCLSRGDDQEEVRGESIRSLVLKEFDGETPGLEIALAADGVATITLSDARRRNPLSAGLLARLKSFLLDCEAAQGREDDAPQVRCVVLESTGTVWSSGHDFGDLSGRSPEHQESVLRLCTEVNLLLRAVPQVTLAAVGGRCLAGGLQLASSCDLLYARLPPEDGSDDGCGATFGLPGVHGGGFCHTPLVSVARALPSKSAAFELAALGCEVGAREAAAMGLATRAVAAADWRATVDATAARLAALFSANAAQGKHLFYEQVAAASAAEAYDMAVPAMVKMFSSPEYSKKMQDFLTGVDNNKERPMEQPASNQAKTRGEFTQLESAIGTTG